MTKVFVTGASGFIAKHILRDLFETGHAVRASVRSERRKADLEALFPDAPLEFAFLDLTQDSGWTEAMAGCEVLIHTASPFPMAQPKDPGDLIRPAVDGTLRALKAARAAGIARVILTSSVAAIYKDAGKPAQAASDERNWTTPDDPSVTAYEASKTLAERAAWDFVAEAPGMSLTTINPGLVLGPPTDARYGTSLDLVARLMSGKDPFAPPIQMPIVDVRDVARMHVAAIDLPASAGERFAAVSETLRFVELGRALKRWDAAARPPTREAPVWLMRALARVMPDLRTLRGNLGQNMVVSSTKAAMTFDLSFIPAADALIASAEGIRRFQP